MARPICTSQVPALPTTPAIELLAAVTLEAQRDAERVVVFLEALGLQGSDRDPLSLPATFLLELGAALRLHEYERVGLSLHRAEGLPSARDALRDCFLNLDQPDSSTGLLGSRLIGLLARRFAWHGRSAGFGTVQLDDLDDNLLDAIAEFCWQNRSRHPMA